jgi:hypothetical protein
MGNLRIPSNYEPQKIKRKCNYRNAETMSEVDTKNK